MTKALNVYESIHAYFEGYHEANERGPRRQQPDDGSAARSASCAGGGFAVVGPATRSASRTAPGPWHAAGSAGRQSVAPEQGRNDAIAFHAASYEDGCTPGGAAHAYAHSSGAVGCCGESNCLASYASRAGAAQTEGGGNGGQRFAPSALINPSKVLIVAARRRFSRTPTPIYFR